MKSHHIYYQTFITSSNENPVENHIAGKQSGEQNDIENRSKCGVSQVEL